jgi:hypothetical protein
MEDSPAPLHSGHFVLSLLIRNSPIIPVSPKTLPAVFIVNSNSHLEKVLVLFTCGQAEPHRGFEPLQCLAVLGRSLHHSTLSMGLRCHTPSSGR